VQVAKICNNLAMAVEMAAVSEALALGAAMGLDPAALTAVFNSSSARCWASQVYNPVPVRGGTAATCGHCSYL
jgi:3-hydroxyisobutyrate dehydrogenase